MVTLDMAEKIRGRSPPVRGERAEHPRRPRYDWLVEGAVRGD